MEEVYFSKLTNKLADTDKYETTDRFHKICLSGSIDDVIKFLNDIDIITNNKKYEYMLMSGFEICCAHNLELAKYLFNNFKEYCEGQLNSRGPFMLSGLSVNTLKWLEEVSPVILFESLDCIYSHTISQNQPLVNIYNISNLFPNKYSEPYTIQMFLNFCNNINTNIDTFNEFINDNFVCNILIEHGISKCIKCNNVNVANSIYNKYDHCKDFLIKLLNINVNRTIKFYMFLFDKNYNDIIYWLINNNLLQPTDLLSNNELSQYLKFNLIYIEIKEKYL